MRIHRISMLLLTALPVVVVAAEPAKQQQGPQEQQAQGREKPQQEQKADATASKGEDAKAGKPAGDVAMSGMSILGNDEAPKSLVIVPWKSSQLGYTPGIERLQDDSTRPVDKDVFMRELAYYEIKQDSR